MDSLYFTARESFEAIHLSYQKQHTITLITTEELMSNVFYCSRYLFLVNGWVFPLRMQVSVKFPVVKDICVFSYLLNILQFMINMNQTSIVIFKTRVTLSKQFQA
jgi:hypothetical protein